MSSAQLLNAIIKDSMAGSFQQTAATEAGGGSSPQAINRVAVDTAGPSQEAPREVGGSANKEASKQTKPEKKQQKQPKKPPQPANVGPKPPVLSGPQMKFIDIGANLLDPMFNGEYHGKKAHPGDLPLVLQRAADAGVDQVIVTAGSLEESRQALEWVRSVGLSSPVRLYNTVGVHPTRCLEFMDGHEGEAGNAAATRHLQSLLEVIQNAGPEVVAIGECGLDYDRLHFCPKEVQLQCFELQFSLAEVSGLPMFLHSRNTGGDFSKLIKQNRHRFTQGVVHSFDGSAQELRELLDAGMFIGINGCSLKTEENLQVMAQVPLDRLMIETDAPWCEVKNTHAGAKFVQSTWDSVKKEKFAEGYCVKNRFEGGVTCNK